MNHQYYYLWIGIADGRLLLAECTGVQLEEAIEAARPRLEEAPDKIQQVKEQAARFLTDNMKIDESYERVRSCYQTTSEGTVSVLADVLFVKADGEAYLLGCGWDGTIKQYAVVTEKDYESSIEKTREVKSSRYTEEYGREVTVQNVWN